MNKGTFQKLLPHLIAIVVFLLVAIIYCNPALQGSVLQQHDIIQWKAMAKNSFDFKEAHGHFPLWTNSMFSGMPAFQIAMDGRTFLPPQYLYQALTLFLPTPISLFFLACICFYFLTQVLRINPYVSIFAALAYAYATYNPIIIVAGHITKMQTIALMPAMIGSLLMVYERRNYWVGLALSAVSAILLIGMNHPQIVYYTFIIVLFMTATYVINGIRHGEMKHLAMSMAIALGAALLGVFSNAVPLFTTYEYSKATIRGGSELASNSNTTTKDGLSEEYAFSYSMYKAEPFVMMVPNMFGGSSEAIEQKLESSKAMETLQSMPPELANQLAGARTAYWGGIGFTSGPPYVGAIVCFLALIGFFVLDGKHKWWILGATVLTIIMSWGSYFEGFNRVLLNVLPMYNKFRAPSMILVVPTLLLCMMAAMSLNKIIATENRNELWDEYKKGLYLTAGVFVVLLLIYFNVDFTSEQDKGILANLSNAPAQVTDYVRSFLNALKDDRKDLFFSSLTRSFLFIAVAAFVLFLALRKNISGIWPAVIIGVLAFIDLMGINVQYLNKEKFQEETEYEGNFTPTPADQQILQDKSDFRVLDLKEGIHNAFNGGAITMYYHKTIGGYHPAKLSIYQDLVEHQLYKIDVQRLSMSPNYSGVINMLNTKYIIFPLQTGDTAIQNPGALGAAWFVKTVRYESDPKAVMAALSNLNPKDTAVLFSADQKSVSFNAAASDSADQVQLVKNENDEVVYKSHSATNRFAVFSEVFYNKGWKAFIDEKEVPIIRTNYVLRGLSIPAGDHQVKFVFHPSSYYTGRTVAMIANILTWLLVLFAVFVWYKEDKNMRIKNG